MSESTPGCQKKGVARADYSSQGDGQQMQSGILSPSPSLSDDRPTNKASGTIDEKKNIRAEIENKGAVMQGEESPSPHRRPSKAGKKSVVELQQVKHFFAERADVIGVNMNVSKVDKDSLVVNFYPDTVHVTFQTRDAKFLKLYKGSTEKTKFSWTIKLKNQAQEDKCSFQVYSSYVYLKITKKVSGRWGDVENIKRTGTNPASDLQATQQNSSGGEGNRNAKPILDAKMTASSADSSTVDNKEAIHPQSSGDERNVEQRPHPKTTAESAYSSTKQPEMSLVADKEDTADVKDFLGSQDSISSIESFIIINPKEADCKEQEKIEHKTQSEFPPAGTSFECMNSKQSRSKSEAAHLEKPVSNDQFCIKSQGSISFVQSIDKPMCLLSLGEAKNAYFEGDLLCVDGRLYFLLTEGICLKSYEVQQLSSGEQNSMALCKDSSFAQEKDKSVKENVATQGNTRDMLEQDHALRPTTRQHSLDNSSAFGSQSVVKQKRKEIVLRNVPTVVVKIISQSSFKSKFRTKFPDDEYKVRNEKSNTADIIITGSLDCFEWFEKEIHYCQITFNEVKNSSIPKLPDIVENYLSNRYCKLGTVFWDIVPKKKQIFVWCSSTSLSAEEVIHTLKIAIKKAELSYDYDDSALATGREKIKKTYNVLHEEVHWNTEGHVSVCMFCFQEDYEDIQKELQTIFQYQRTAHEKSGHSTDATVNDHRAHYSIENGKSQTISVRNEEVVNLKADVIVVLKEKEIIGDASKCISKNGNQILVEYPQARHEESRAKHKVAESTQYALAEIKKGNHFKVAVACSYSKSWTNGYKYLQFVLVEIFRFLKQNAGIRYSFLLCSSDKFGYSACQQILREGKPDDYEETSLPNDEIAHAQAPEGIVQTKSDPVTYTVEKPLAADDSNLPEKESMQDLQDKLNIAPSTIKLTGYNGKGRVRKRGNKSLPYTGEISPNCENELNDECSYNKTSNDDAIKAKHNASGSKTDLHNRNNTHPAADSEYESSSNVVSSGGASKKQAFQIKQDSSTVKLKSKSSCCDIQANSSERSRTNGTYSFSKEGGHWCIVDAKSEEMLTVLDCEADDIYFKGMKVVVVDDEYHTIKEDDGVVELRSVHKQSLISKNNDNLLHNTTKSFQCKSTQTIHTDFDCEGIQKQDEAPPPLPPRNPIDRTTTVVKSKAFGNPLPAYTKSPKITEKEASRSTHDSTRPSLIGQNKLRVQVLKDDIINVKADVIVNSTSVDLNLDRGHVSSQINKLAGTELQKAMYRKAKEINFWEYIVTSAFDLSNCKHIFHCALEPLNDNDVTKQEKSCLSKMRATVRLLLNEANRMSCNSIALPALGTGYLGYKPRDAATAIFLAVSDFVQFHGDRSHLEDITIVIYQTEENTFQAFKKVEAEMKPELATLTPRF